MFIVVLSGVLAFLICVVLLPRFIPFLHRLKFGQSIRVEGPKSHQAKQGTPTMGGIVFVIACIIALILVKPFDFFAQPMISITIVFIGFFIIGLVDDLLIVVKKKNDGLSPKKKLLAQALVTILLFIISNKIFSDSYYTTLDVFGMHLDLGHFYILFALFMFIAYSNAINLTDGLDGLSSITSIIAFAFMGVIAYSQENYLVLTYIVALIGALLGFYLFNKKPAKIFMGDTGSLALGGFYAIIALLLKVELLSIVIGFVFVLETVSVVLQVFSFKVFKRRIFKMAPLHHHFELKGLGEQKTVSLFYVIGLISGVVGMVIYFV